METKTSSEHRGTGFLTLNEAASELGCTRRFLEMRIEDGEIRVFKPSARLIRIRRSDFDGWVESYSSAPAAGEAAR